MSYFSYKPQVRIAYCKQCKRETRQSKGCDRALFTCIDPHHVHPTREQQEEGVTRPGVKRFGSPERWTRKRGGPKKIGEVLQHEWCTCGGEPPCPVGSCPTTKGIPIGPDDFGGKDY